MYGLSLVVMVAIVFAVISVMWVKLACEHNAISYGAREVCQTVLKKVVIL